MPHAALYVVQLLSDMSNYTKKSVSMPHAALYVVQPTTCPELTTSAVSMPHAALYVVQHEIDDLEAVSIVSMPHAALYVVQQRVFQDSRRRIRGFNAARSILCGATIRVRPCELCGLRFQCRTQHFMWCNRWYGSPEWNNWCFNAARSILCGATNCCSRRGVSCGVSMPHAAFYVVQRANIW